MNFEFGENVRILLLGEKHKEVLYGELESIAERELSAFDDLDRGTKLRAQIDFLSIQKEIKEDKEIAEAILRHNLKVENIELHNEICKKRKELKGLQEAIERLEKQYEYKNQRLREVEDCIQKCKRTML